MPILTPIWHETVADEDEMGHAFSFWLGVCRVSCLVDVICKGLHAAWELLWIYGDAALGVTWRRSRTRIIAAALRTRGPTVIDEDILHNDIRESRAKEGVEMSKALEANESDSRLDIQDERKQTS